MKFLNVVKRALQCLKMAMDLWDRFGGGNDHFWTVHRVLAAKIPCRRFRCIAIHPLKSHQRVLGRFWRSKP